MVYEINGARVYCEITGSGKPILLLHGWGGKCESMAPVARDMALSHTVISLDFPGHGRSSDPPAPWSVTEYSNMTSTLVKRAGFDSVDVVAHSFGGRVALCMAASHPDMVRRIVLSGVPALRKPPSFKSKTRSAIYKALKGIVNSALFKKIAGEDKAENLNTKVQNMFGSADYKALSPFMRKTFVRVINQDLSEYLPKIASETVLFWGENDTAAPLWIARDMEKIMPDAGVVVMPGAGHFAYLDRYPEFLAVLNSFLN